MRRGANVSTAYDMLVVDAPQTAERSLSVETAEWPAADDGVVADVNTPDDYWRAPRSAAE